MSTQLSVTINAPSPTLERKSSEVAFLLQALDDVARELGRGNGTVTSGTAAGKGSWTYTQSATLP
jgi:hypothetical protein